MRRNYPVAFLASPHPVSRPGCADPRRTRSAAPMSTGHGRKLRLTPRKGGGDSISKSPSPCGRGLGGGVTETNINTRRARALRNNLTDTERSLWSRLKRKQIHGHKFRLQFPVGPYIVDFVCLEARLIIEVDGGQHAEQKQGDEIRDQWLSSQNFHVLRFWNNEVLSQTDAVIDTIVQALKSTPTPSLPRKGGGRTRQRRG